MRTVTLTVNGEEVTATVEPRTSLADFLREERRLTGTHLGCEHGVCGACTINLDGVPSRSCIAYAATLDGADIRTIEGFDVDNVMEDLRQAFTENHGLQCGYCTPGILMSVTDFLDRYPEPSEEEIKDMLSGHICRCTGYVGMVRAVQDVVQQRNQGIS